MSRLLLILAFALPLRADIDAFARKLMDAAGTTPGIAVAVIEGDKVTYTGAFGLRDVEAKQPVTAETLFYIASSTKPFTAAAARLLAAEGKLDLDAPLSKSIPGLKLTPPLDVDRVSLRDLLAHRPGFTNGAVNFRTANPGNMDRAAMLAALEKHSSVAPIEFGYSNTSYLVAGLAIEQAAGVPWNEVLASRIFAPLSMRSTFAAIPPAGLPVSAGYVDVAHGRFRRMRPKEARTLHAAGGIFTTAGDLARFLIANMNEGANVFPARVVRDLHAPQVSLFRKYGRIDRFAYALGWYHGDYEGDLLVHHFGGFNGFHAHMSFMPKRRIGVVVLSNGGGDVAEALAGYIYDLRLGKKDLAAKYDAEIARIRESAGKQRAAIAKVDARKAERRSLTRPMSAYAGEYVSDRLGTVVVRERDGRLVADYGIMSNELLVESGDAFVIDWASDDTLQNIKFVFDTEGKAKTFEWDGRVFERR